MGKGKGLIELIKLKNEDYVSIQHNGIKSYGGNQSWWSKENPLINKQGCGVISMCDLELYLSMTNQNRQGKEKDNCSPITYWEYKRYIDDASNSRYRLGVGHNVNNLGLMPFTMIKGLKEGKETGGRQGLREQARIKWAPSTNPRKVKEYIIDMISRDIPVVASYYVFIKENRLSLYMYDTKKERMEKHSLIKSHYFNITGLLVLGDEEYLSVSTWGKRYYISFDEWAKKLSLFSNILLIR